MYTDVRFCICDDERLPILYLDEVIYSTNFQDGIATHFLIHLLSFLFLRVPSVLLRCFPYPNFAVFQYFRIKELCTVDQCMLMLVIAFYNKKNRS
jgi:hypothetical protein